jgi:hypothetical protein
MYAGPFIPRTAILLCPLKNVQVTIHNGFNASHSIPRTVVLSQALEKVEVTMFGSVSTPLCIGSCSHYVNSPRKT